MPPAEAEGGKVNVQERWANRSRQQTPASYCPVVGPMPHGRRMPPTACNAPGTRGGPPGLRSTPWATQNCMSGRPTQGLLHALPPPRRQKVLWDTYHPKPPKHLFHDGHSVATRTALSPRTVWRAAHPQPPPHRACPPTAALHHAYCPGTGLHLACTSVVGRLPARLAIPHGRPLGTKTPWLPPSPSQADPCSLVATVCEPLAVPASSSASGLEENTAHARPRAALLPA